MSKRIYGYTTDHSGHMRVWSCDVVRETAKSYIVPIEQTDGAMSWPRNGVVPKMLLGFNVFESLDDLKAAATERLDGQVDKVRKVEANLVEALATINEMHEPPEPYQQPAAQRLSPDDIRL